MKEAILGLGKDTLIYGIGSMVSRFISLLLLPLFTAYLAPADYGIMAMLALLAMVAQPVFGLGMGAAMGPAYFQGNDPNRKSATVWTAFLLLLASSCVLLVLAWAVPAPLSRLVTRTDEHSLLVSLTLTGTVFGILATPFTMRMQFDRKTREFVRITLLGALLSTALSVVAVAHMGWGVKGMIAAQAVGQALNFLMFLAAGARGTAIAYAKPIGAELLRLGIPLVPGFAFIFILLQGNRYILQWLEGLDQVGIYSIGFNIGMVMTIVVGGVTQAWYPFFMSYIDKPEDARRTFGVITYYYVIIVGGITVLFFILAHPMILLLTKPPFHQAYLVVGFSAMSQFLVGLFSLLAPGMYFQKEVRFVSLWQGISAMVSLPLGFIMVTHWGLFGAGLALTVSSTFLPLSQWLWNQHRKRDYVAIDYPWRRLAIPALTYLGTAAASLLLVPDRLIWSITFSILLCAGLTAFAYWQVRLVGSFPSLLKVEAKAA